MTILSDATPIGDDRRAWAGNCHKCGFRYDVCRCPAHAFTARPGVRVLAPLVYVIELDETYVDPTPEKREQIIARAKAELPPGATVLVTSPGMTFRQVTPPAPQLINTHDDLYVDAARVVSVEACTSPGAYPYVKIVWQEHEKQAACQIVSIPKGIEAARRLAADIAKRVNRARNPEQPVVLPAGAKVTPLEKVWLRHGYGPGPCCEAGTCEVCDGYRASQKIVPETDKDGKPWKFIEPNVGGHAIAALKRLKGCTCTGDVDAGHTFGCPYFDEAVNRILGERHDHAMKTVMLTKEDLDGPLGNPRLHTNRVGDAMMAQTKHQAETSLRGPVCEAGTCAICDGRREPETERAQAQTRIREQVRAVADAGFIRHGTRTELHGTRIELTQPPREFSYADADSGAEAAPPNPLAWVDFAPAAALNTIDAEFDAGRINASQAQSLRDKVYATSAVAAIEADLAAGRITDREAAARLAVVSGE